MKKGTQAVLYISLLIVLIFSLNSGAQIPVYQRNFKLGLAYVTANRQVLSIDTAYNKIADAAEIAYIQGSWPEWESGMFDNDIQIARRKGLKIYLALDFLGYVPVARATIALPPSLKASLGTDTATFMAPGLPEAYTTFVKQLVRKYSPDYFVPMVEINLHKGPRPGSYSNFVQLYPQLYRDIKTLSPSTLVGPSITYGDNASPSGFGPEDRNAFKTFLADFEANSDINAVSMYPAALFPTATGNPLVLDLHPETIPDIFLSELAGFSKNPLFIAENSWDSQGFSVPVGTLTLSFNTTQQDQKNYVYRLAQSAKTAQDSGKRIAAINFTSLIDPTPAVTALLIQSAPQLEWFCYLGFFDGSGVGKPAFSALKEWKQLPYTAIHSADPRKIDNRPIKVLFTNSSLTIHGLKSNSTAMIVALDGRVLRVCIADASGTIKWNFTENSGKRVGKGTYLLWIDVKRQSMVFHLSF